MVNQNEKYIKRVNENFVGESKNLLLKQIDLFYRNDCIIQKNKYKIGDEVFLKKGTFLHVIFGELENFDYTIDN